MASINHKTVQGIEVFNVGKKQAWILFNWKGYANKYAEYCTRVASSAICQSMAKGRWLVVACNTVFGGGNFGHRVHIDWDGKTLREALDWAKWYQDHGTVYEADDIVSRTHVTEYEIWHIVDDGDLWDAWEDEAHKNTQPDCTMLEIGECERCASCWACGFNKQNVSYRPVSHRGDVFCTYCGDDDYGPWISYYIPSVGYCYVCEDCEGQAKRDGGHYVKLGAATYNAAIPF